MKLILRQDLVSKMRHDVAQSADRSIGNFNKQLERMAEACRQIADYALTYGITTSVENHGYFVQHSDRVQALIQAVDRPNFRTTLDVGNFMCADENSVAAVKNNISYASMVHIKDFICVRHTKIQVKAGFKPCKVIICAALLSGTEISI